MTTVELTDEIGGRILELSALSHTLEMLFGRTSRTHIDNQLFDGISFFSMQRRMCDELSDLHDNLKRNLEKGIV